MQLGSPLSSFAGRGAAVRLYAWSTANMALGIVAHSVGLIVLARAMGAEQYGLLTIVTTVSSLGLVWVGLGGGEVLRRRVARDRGAYAETFGHVLLLIAGASLAATVILSVGLAMTVKISPHWSENLLVMALLVFANTGLFAWIGQCEQIFLAHDDVASANLVSMSAGVGRALAAVIACHGFGVSELKDWAYWHFGFNMVVATGCTLAIARFGAPRLRILRDEVWRGASVSATNLLVMLRQSADILALSAVAPPAVVGIYSLARRIVDTAGVFGASLDRLVYSSFAKAGRGGPAATLPLAVRYAGYSLVVCGGASLALYLTSPLVPLVFGSPFAPAVSTLRILSWSLVLVSLQWLAADALNAAEQHGHRLMAETLAGAVGTAVLVTLTLMLGLDGILASIYISGALAAAALWGVLWWLADRQSYAGLVPNAGIVQK